MDVPALRRNIQSEEVRFRFAVAESVGNKIGGSVNFINDFQYSEKQFFINGRYNTLALPFNEIDGFTFFQFNALIIDVWMFIQFSGTSGVTELDIKRATTPGGSFSSIFSTTPKISQAAGNNYWVHVGSTGLPGGTVAPILSLTNMNAWDALRCDIIQAQVGSAVNGCGLLIHYQPR